MRMRWGHSSVSRRAIGAVVAVAATTAGLLVAVAAPSGAIVVQPGGTVYVTDFVNNQVIPVAQGATIAGTPIQLGAGTNPIGVEITADGTRAYVADSGSDNVSPVALTSQTVGTPIPVGSSGANSQYLAISPDGSQAYVANEYADNVTPINTSTNQAGTPFPMGAGSEPVAVAFTPDGRTAYVANYGAGTVTPINTLLKRVGTPINVGYSPDALQITPDGTTLYVVNYGSGTVTPINVANNQAGTDIQVGSYPTGIAITPDGKSAYVSNSGDDTVTPIDLTNNTPAAAIGLSSGSYPSSVAVSPDGSTIYVTEFATGGLAEISTATKTLTRTVDLNGAAPLGLAVTPDQAPTAHLSVTPGPAGSPTTLNASTSTAGSTAIVNYHFDFGDGSSVDSASPTVTHVYASAGQYTATVTVTDAAGTSTTAVYTGQMVLRNGSSNASASATFQVLGPSAGATPVVYAANYGSATVTPIATAPTFKAGSPISVHPNPTAFAITPDGRTGYAVNSGDGTVVPVDINSNLSGTPIVVGNEPTAIAITPDGTEAYVANEGGGSLSVITLKTGAVRTISLSGAQPDAVAIDPAGNWVYVADLNGDGIIPVRVDNDAVGSELSTGAGSDPDGLAISPDGSSLYVATKGTNSVLIVTLSGGSGTITNTVSLGAGSSPSAIAVTPDGSTVYATLKGANKVAALGVPALNIVGVSSLANGSAPDGIAIAPNGSAAYVAESGTNKVVAITLPATPGTEVSVGNAPAGVAVTPDEAPVAHLSVSPGLAGSPTVLDASGSSAPSSPIVTYAWKFGDGNTSSGPSSVVQHTYAVPGDYTVTVTLTDAAGTSTTQVFTGQTVSRNGNAGAQTSQTFHVYGPAPTVNVNGMSPTSGPAGTLVTITGTWLYGASVTFGVVSAPAGDITVSPDGKTLTVFAPTGPPVGVPQNVTITTPGPNGNQNVVAGQFTYTPGQIRPSISSIQPTDGVGGTPVAILGSDLGNVDSVTFGGITAPIEHQTDTEIDVAAPPGTPGTSVTVTVHQGATSVDAPQQFTYDSPSSMQVYRIIPVHGQPGDIVEIDGANLGPATSVTFAGHNATITQHSTALLKVRVPTGINPGTSVTVTVHAGQAFVNVPGQFTIDPMVVTSMTPTTAAAGALVSIIGTGLKSARKVKFGATLATIKSKTRTKLVVIVPAGAPGTQVSVVVNSGTVNVTVPGLFTYQ